MTVPHMCPNGFFPALQGVDVHCNENFAKEEAPHCMAEKYTRGELQALVPRTTPASGVMGLVGMRGHPTG